MIKILLPVDFSGHTEITCRYAIEVARPGGAEIKLFHTYFENILLTDTSFQDTLDLSTIYNDELMKEIFHQALTKMDDLEEKMNQWIDEEKLQGVSITTLVTGGEPEHELMSVCAEYRPSLVMTGTRGKGMNVNTWGKVAGFIIDHAHVPVMTIPGIDRFLGFGSVMFAADLSDGNESVIRNLVDLYKPFRTVIHVVHFLQRTRQTDEYLRMTTLRQKFALEEQEGRIRFEIAEVTDDNQNAVNRFAHDNDIRMIAFQPHRHNMLYKMFTKNLTRKNLIATNIPLVAVPEPR